MLGERQGQKGGGEGRWRLLGSDSSWPLDQPVSQTQTPGASACQSSGGTKLPIQVLQRSPLPAAQLLAKHFPLIASHSVGRAAAHICGNQAMATPPTRPVRLPQPGSPRPKFLLLPPGQESSSPLPSHQLFSQLGP